jgi:DNA-binding transcriptional regulator YiaG
MITEMPPKRATKPPTPAQIKAARGPLTQTQAAIKIGVTQRTWSGWETGAVVPSSQSAILIRLMAAKKI